jgi:hypothetical protein
MFIDCDRLDVKEHAVSILCEISYSNPNLITFDIYDMLRFYKCKSNISLSHAIKIALQQIRKCCVHLHAQIDDNEKILLATYHNNNNAIETASEHKSDIIDSSDDSLINAANSMEFHISSDSDEEYQKFDFLKYNDHNKLVVSNDSSNNSNSSNIISDISDNHTNSEIDDPQSDIDDMGSDTSSILIDPNFDVSTNSSTSSSSSSSSSAKSSSSRSS